MTEELMQIAEVINSLGDKGLIAFIVWVVADLLGDILVGTGLIAGLWIVARYLYKAAKDGIL
jgi:hypothetical protein